MARAAVFGTPRKGKTPKPLNGLRIIGELLPAFGRPLRVAFVDQSGASVGGAERSLQLLLAHLSNAVEVVVVLFADGRFADELRERGIAVEIVPLPAGLQRVRREHVLLHNVFATVRATWTLARVLRRLHPDIVYTNTIKAHVIGALAARFAGVRCVAHLRDILQGRARRVVRTAILAGSHARIAISGAVSESFGLSATSVVPNPLDLDAYAELVAKDEARRMLSLPQHVPLVGIIGRINRWKGHDRFLRIAARVTRESPAHFAIVGAPVFRDADFVVELRALASELGIAERVHYVPWLDDPRVAYAALDVHCNTSFAEPFGRTTIEAAASGLPTVSFDDGGARDAILPGRTGMLVPPGDEAGFARAILSYVQDPRELQAAAREARAFAKTFDARLHAARVEQILLDLKPVAR